MVFPHQNEKASPRLHYNSFSSSEEHNKEVQPQTKTHSNKGKDQLDDVDELFAVLSERVSEINDYFCAYHGDVYKIENENIPFFTECIHIGRREKF